MGEIPSAEVTHQWQCRMVAEETFCSVGFESILSHLEIISDGKPIKMLNDRIDISKLKSHNEPKNSPIKFIHTVKFC